MTTPHYPTDPTSPTLPNKQRLYSLDALRGFDMFWIMGAEGIFHALAKTTGWPVFEVISGELEHPAWNGFHFYDLIFPLFLFIAGVATPYSVGRELAKGKTKGQVLLRVFRRAMILVLLGVIYNNGLHLRPLADIRFASVLGRIGIAYMFANIIYLYAGRKAQMIWFGALLIGYWLVLKFASAPGFPPGDLSMEGNFASYFDRLFLPGKLYLKIHDPEGLFSTIPAIATGLLGILTGTYIKNAVFSGATKALRIALTGIIFLGLSYLWNLDFPINKNLWTSSFVLHVGGWSLLLLALFYYLIDVLGYVKWSFFFRVIGMNSILIYMVGRFLDFRYSTQAFFQWLSDLAGDPYNVVVMAACFVMVKWLFLYFMYRKKVFLSV